MSNQPSTVLAHDVVLACTDPWGRSVGVPTTMGFRSSDPYAVTLTFHSNSGDVEWVVARSLLMQGLALPAGDGDVRVFPSIDVDARAVGVFDFSSPDGRLVAQLVALELREFLDRTLELVPAGTESEHIDIDSLVQSLLSDAE